MSIRKRKQTHRHGKETSGYEWGEGRGKGQIRGRGLRDPNYYL